MLGKISNDEVRLSKYGEIVEKWWGQVPHHFTNVECDDYVIMPNHFHGIIVILDHLENVHSPTLGNILAYFKYQSTKEINLIRRTPGTRFWQRNYHDHIIRNIDDYRIIYDYI